MTLKLLKSFLKYITIFIVALIAILLCFYLYLISGSAKQGDITWHSSILTYWAMSRDVALSAPAIDYGGVEDTDEQGNTSTKAYMDACIQHTGVDILLFISSKEVVKDLDRIRTQLDVDVWSMVGYSYGTKLVAKYAEHYLTHLRAGVADGVVDTSESLFTILKKSVQRLPNHL